RTNHLFKPPFNLDPDIPAKRLVMPSTRNENQPLRASKRSQYSFRMLRWGLDVGCSMDQKHRTLDLRSIHHWAHRVHSKPTLLFRKREGSLDDARRKEKWGPLGRHRAKVGKRFCCDYRGHPRISRGLLQRHGRAQGRAYQYHRARANGVEYSMEVLLLEESVGAHVT